MQIGLTATKKAWEDRVRDLIASVQPMTDPVGGIQFYRSRYGNYPECEQLRLFSDCWYDDLPNDRNSQQYYRATDDSVDIAKALAVSHPHGFSSRGKSKSQGVSFQT